MEVLNRSFSSGTYPIVQRSSSITTEMLAPFDATEFVRWLDRFFVNVLESEQLHRSRQMPKRVTNQPEMGISSKRDGGCVWVWHCSSLICALWQHCVWCIKSGVIRCTRRMVLYLDHWMTVCDSTGYTLCPGLAAEPHSSLPQNFCLLLSVPLEQFWWPCIRWCGAGDFQEQGQWFFIGLRAALSFL